MVLRPYSQDGKEYSKPRSSDGSSCLAGSGRSVSGTVFKIDHELGFKVVNVHDEAPERLRYLFVRSKQPDTDEQLYAYSSRLENALHNLSIGGQLRVDILRQALEMER